VGHKAIANLALANIKPETRAKIDALLAQEAQIGTPECKLTTLADAAVWPDCVRADKLRWTFTFPWHFQDGDVLGTAFDPRANCANTNCVTKQIERNERLLGDTSLPAPIRLEALAFVVHFVGDIHQPLHAAELEHDEGGNRFKVTWPNPKGGPDVAGNLHWLWDSVEAERGLALNPAPLVRAYSADERKALATGGTLDWAQESWVLARDVVYGKLLGHAPQAGDLPGQPVTITQAQIDAGAPVARQRLLLAGLRLARVLDTTLSPAAAK